MRYSSIKAEPLSSLRNALRLLNLLNMDEPELNVSELAERLEVGLSTSHRLASTLANEGFIVKDPKTKNYRLDPSILAMGNIIISHMEISRVSSSILERLALKSGETVHIAILRNNKVIYLNKVDSVHPVYMISHAGKQNPAHCTSSGKVILAYQPESYIENVIAMGLPAYTVKSITVGTQLKELLKNIRQQGYALSIEELHEGISSIAAPVKHPSGKTVASVNIAGPTQRINPYTIPKLVKMVMKAADDVTEQYSKTFERNMKD